MNNSSLETLPHDIVLDQYGQVYNPIDIRDDILITLKFVCCIIGIPLNVSIAVTIIRHRRLHRKPRNIFLLGIIFSYLSFFITPIIELIYWGLLPHESLCLAYVAVIPLPHFLLLWNMLLALADRFVAIKYPLLHREKMTVCLASCVVCFSSILLPFLLKFVYIFRLVPLRCVMWLVRVKILLAILAVLFVSCTALNFVVYRKTKVLLHQCRTLHPPPEDHSLSRNNFESIELAPIENDWRCVRASTSSVTHNENSSTVIRPMSIHVDRRKLSQIEMETTLTLIFGVTSLVVIVCPYVIFICLFSMCRLVSQSECSNFNWLSPYLIEMGLINAVYSPLIFLMRNGELLKALLTCRVCARK
jgi:hypothetical protein